MPNNIGTLLVELGVNSAAFVAGLDKATYKAKESAHAIGNSFKGLGENISGILGKFGEMGGVIGEAFSGVGSTIAKVSSEMGSLSGSAGAAAIAISVVGAAGIAAASGLAAIAKQGAEVIERLSHISQKTGISVHDLQVLEAAGNTVGVSLEQMTIAFRKFDQAITNNGKHAGAANSILKALGVTSHENKEAMLQAADAFKKMEDGPRKAADAVALFGKSGLDMIPFLNKGRDGILEFEEAVNVFGPKITESGVKSTEAWKIANEKLSMSFKDLTVRVADDVLPMLTKVTELAASSIRGFGVASGAGLRAIAAYASGRDPATAASLYLAERTAETAGPSEAETKRLKNSQDAVDAYKNHYKGLFEMQKAGSEAQLSLDTARNEVAEALAQENFKSAAQIQSTIPMLERNVELYKEQVDAAERIHRSWLAMEKSFANPSRPFAPVKRNEKRVDTSGLFGPQPTAGVEAPDIAQHFEAQEVNPLGKLFGSGKDELEAFYAEWNLKAQGTAASINKSYDEQLKHWKQLLNDQAISQNQFNSISFKLEAARQEGLKNLRKEMGESEMGESFGDMFADIERRGKDFSRSLASDVGGAIEGINSELAKVAATGGRLDFRKIGQSFVANITSSSLSKLESIGAGALGLSGIGKHDGSSRSAPLFVQDVSGANLLPAMGQNPIAAALQPSSSGGGLFSGGFASILSSVLSFLPGLAGGGDVTPGKAYVVGENAPEFFVPNTAGRIEPTLKTGGSGTTINNFAFHGVTDHDSFQRNKAQVAQHIANAVGRGNSRR
jgi:hypothetical protein